MTAKMLTIDPDFSGNQIPTVGDILLMTGLSATQDNEEYGRRLKAFCKTTVKGLNYGRNTLLIATELIEEAAQTFAHDFKRREHLLLMQQRAAELLIAMTPHEHSQHPHVRQARNYVAQAA
jgi:hypothetical protein